MLKNWIFASTLIVSSIVLERSLYPVRMEAQELEKKSAALSAQISINLEKKKALEEILMSQSDFDWQMLTLIRVLGVVPEGSKKVIFKSP